MPDNKNEKMFREFKLECKSVNEEERRVSVSFSSEEPYKRFFGDEILDHSDGAVDLKRLTEIGVALWNHNRDVVIGKLENVRIEDNRGYADIVFDEDDESEKIFKKVKSGTLKGVSVGYLVTEWEEVAAGKKSRDGRFSGPCSVAIKWLPFEISIVSIPADISVGVNRAMSEEMRNTLMLCEKQIVINKNIYGKEKHNEN